LVATASTTMKQVGTSAPASTTVAAIPGPCSDPCGGGMAKETCQSRLQKIASQNYRSDPRSCWIGVQLAIEQCPGCSQCSLTAAACDNLPEKPRSASSIPDGPSPGAGGPARAQGSRFCDNVCVVNEQSATCNARIQWVSQHMFHSQPNSCARAHQNVLQQCGDSCGECALEAVDCKDSEGTVAYSVAEYSTRSLSRSLVGQGGHLQQSDGHWVTRCSWLVAAGFLVLLTAFAAARQSSRLRAPCVSEEASQSITQEAQLLRAEAEVMAD
jgi:hypothetical protein